jgi:hypothetical protein
LARTVGRGTMRESGTSDLVLELDRREDCDDKG